MLQDPQPAAVAVQPPVEAAPTPEQLAADKAAMEQAAKDAAAAELAAHPQTRVAKLLAHLRQPHIGEDRLAAVTSGLHELVSILQPLLPPLPVNPKPPQEKPDA